MIFEAIEIAATGSFAAYAFYRSGAFDKLAAEIRRGTALTPPQKSVPPKPTPAGEFERYALQADHEERQKLLASPTGWLLDPFRYPTNPHEGRTPRAAAAIDEILDTLARMDRVHNGLEPHFAVYRPEHTFRIVTPTVPRCPSCGEHKGVAVTADHGGEASAWICNPCQVEFTKAGETRASKKARKSLPSVLPCGCTGAVEQDHILNYGRESTCRTCFSTWEPRSDDFSGRTLGQGERVRWSASKRRAGFGEQDVPFDLPLPPANRD